jgi:hypothetical protein
MSSEGLGLYGRITRTRAGATSGGCDRVRERITSNVIVRPTKPPVSKSHAMATP